MKKPSLYIRKTKDPHEEISAFLIKPQPEGHKVNVTLRSKVWEVESHLVTSYNTTKLKEHKRLKKSQDGLLFLDGLDQGNDELKNFNSHNYLSTSAGHDSPQEARMSLVILSGWEKEILRLAIVDCLRLLPPSPQHPGRSHATSPWALGSCVSLQRMCLCQGKESDGCGWLSF